MAPPLELLVRRKGADQAFVIQHLDSMAVFLRLRPKPATDVVIEIQAVEDADGTCYVVRNATTQAYLRLRAEEYFLWESLDGRTRVAELVAAYFVRYGSLDLGRIRTFIQKARKAGLIDDLDAEIVQVRKPTGRLARWLALDFSWGGADARCRQALPWVAALLPASSAAFWAPVTLWGLWTWLQLHREPVTHGFFMWLVVCFIGVGLHLFPHEAAHAFACARFRRRVGAVGITFRRGLPMPYVDTTDMYMSTRERHALVALAGPAANLVSVAVLAILGSQLEDPSARWVFRTLADAGALVALLTGWPFLTQGDGYNALTDLIGVPFLHRDAQRWLQHLLRRKPITLAPALRWRYGLYLAGVGLSWATLVGGVFYRLVVGFNA